MQGLRIRWRGFWVDSGKTDTKLGLTHQVSKYAGLKGARKMFKNIIQIIFKKEEEERKKHVLFESTLIRGEKKDGL